MARNPFLPARPVGGPRAGARPEAFEEPAAHRPEGPLRVPPPRARTSGARLTEELAQRWRTLAWLPGSFSVCRLPAGSAVRVPSSASLFSVTTTDSETSVVCDDRETPEAPDAKCEPGWTAFRLAGPIPFATTGVLASLSAPLAAAGIGVFVLSTYDTDVVLVKTSDASAAEHALKAAGFSFGRPD